MSLDVVPSSTTHLFATVKESDDIAVRNELSRFFEENDYQNQLDKMKPDSRSFLLEAVPTYKSTITYSVCKTMIGKTEDDLSSVLEKNVFTEDIKRRKVVGIVQAYGTGKTRSAMELSSSYVVLAWRPNRMDSCTIRLEREQQNSFAKLSFVSTIEEVEKFSKDCLRLVRLTLLARMKLFDLCSSNAWIDSKNKEHRRAFCSLQIMSSDFERWSKRWFTENVNMSSNEIESEERRFIEKHSPTRVVFVIDEPQKLMNMCRGYCLHTKSEKRSESEIELWKKEQVHGIQGSTDLFYQLREVVMNHLRSNKETAGFVTCSRRMGTWNSFESKDEVVKFFNLRQSSGEDVVKALRSQFDVPDEWLRRADVSAYFPEHFRRPCFTSNLFSKLAYELENLPDDPRQRSDWFAKHVTHTAETHKNFASAELQSSTIDSSKHLLEVLYRIEKNRGRVCILDVCISETDEKSIDLLSHVVNVGFVRLQGGERSVRIADEVYRAALLELGNVKRGRFEE